MSQSCTYTFKGPDGRKMTIEGASALKAYLATGGLEFLLGEARAGLARRPEQALASRDRPGINVRSDGDNRYADLIVDGTKTMESRDSDSLRPYVGKTVGVVRTGEGPARLVGSVTVGEPMEVDATEFRAREDEHLVPEGSTFDIKPGKTKWLYPLTGAQRFEQEQPVGSRGIVSRKVRFSPDRAQIETPEFKRWFGDSKVVDAQGKPLVVYHGTKDDFAAFDRSKIESEDAFFFSDSPEHAGVYAGEDPEDGGSVMPVYLSLKNPYIVDVMAWNMGDVPSERALRRRGHDGLIIENQESGTTYAVFRPAQIKSATGNRGTFDPDDPDIRRSEGRQELPRGYVGSVSEEEREQGLLVKRLEDESFEAWGAGREKVTADTVRWVTERMREAGIEDPAVKEASISAVRSLSLGKIAPGGEYDPETHPYFSDYRAAAGRLQSARNALQQMISARLGPPEFEGMRQLADFDREQVRTPEFRRWFKDSKVVDGQGRPLIVFHGTNKDLSEFATVREAGAVRNNNWFGQLGSWFAAPQPGVEDYEPGSAESTAEGFSELRGDEGSVVYPVYLSIQNPYEVEGYESLTEERDDAGGAAAFRQMLVKQGYDGVVVRDSDTDGGQIRDDWVAFYPTQIKSAIGNTGAFAADNPDITKSSGRDVRPLSIEQDSREWAVDGEPTITLNKANFGGRSGLEWVDGDNENYVTSIAAYGDARGHEMLRWLKDHTGKPSFAVSAVDDAIGFYERMGEIGLMSGYTQDTVDSFFGIDFGDGEPQRYAGDVRFNRDDARRSAERFTDDQREELERAGRDAEDAIRSAPRDYNVDLTAQQEAEKPAKAWIEKVYAGLPRNPMMPRQRVMMFGEDDFAVLELDASGLNPGGVTINWIQAYPLRSGNGTKAIRELQRMAAEDGIELDLWPWDKGRVSQANLIKFYKSVGFEPIKRGSKNMIWRPEGVSRSAERSPLGFYSALAKGIEGLPTKQAPAGAWKAAIKGLVNKGQVKADEVEWSSINDWLDLQQGKVTKEQVSEYLKQGGVRVEETMLGDQRAAARALRVEEVYPEGDQWTVLFDDGTSVGISQEIAEDEQSAEAEARTLLEERGSGVSPTAAAKYSQYTLPGGENYREVLLRLPHRGDYETPNGARFTQEELSDPVVRATVDKIGKAPVGAYRSTHWDQPNVLAHIRLNDRTDADGKRVLFVEELQSDWGQEGKKKGFRRTLSAAQQKRVGELNRVTEERDFTDAEQAEYDSLRDGFSNDAGLPAAPFVTKTEGWLNLALKRVMIMAAEGGYDKVAFVNGEQSAERFSLDKQIDSVSWRPAGTDRATITISPKSGAAMIGIVDTNTGVFPRFESGVFGGEALESVLGKEIAERVLASPEGSLAGDGLKVEAKGMRAFYDTIVPTAVKKLLPKVGGGQMGNVNINSEFNVFQIDDGLWGNNVNERTFPSEKAAREAAGIPQPGFDVTPAMREKVSEGLPLFSRDRAAWTDERIDSLLSEHAYTMDDGRSKAYAGFVSPEDYLRATTPASGVERLESEKRPLDAKQLADQVQPIFLKGGPQGDGTWKTTGHEGRHRMMALRDAGVRRVPVVFDVGYGLTREPIERLYVTPQRWSGAGQAQGGFFVDNLIPISYKHADDLRDVFGGEGAVRFSPDRAQTDTPEFKAWFGDSKVVNALGRPRVVYHGTAGDVAIFDMGRAGQTYGLEGEKAFFFTGRIPTAESAADDATGLPAYARKYAYQGFGGGDQGDYGDNYSDEPYDISADYNGGQNLMPVYLSLQNPLIIDAPYGRGAGDAFENGREAPGQLIERAKREGYDGIIIRGKYRNREQMARILANTWTTEADKKKYLDELARKDARKHQTDHYFIAFRPDQIKSAIGNVGAYGQRQITEEEANRFGMGAMEANFRQHEGDIRFSVDRDYRPEKTVKAYKLFRMDERRPGELFPLFVDADRPVPMGEWLSAQAGPAAAGGKVKSKLGPLAYRPGWHAGDLPVATHIGMKKAASDGKPGLRNPEHVWAEVEMAADVDWQAEANKRGTNKDGKVVPVKAHITDEIPRRGFYRYKTNPNMTGNWLIGGEMRVLRLLSDSEVQRINKDAGAADLPRKEPLDLNRFGFGPNITRSAGRQTDTPEFRRWFGGSKVVDKSGQPLVVYHGTYSDNIEVFDRMFMREKYGREALDQVGTWFSDRADDDGAGMYVGGNGANIVPAYLAIKNPWTVRFQGLWNKAQDLSGQPRDERPNAKSVAALDKWMDDNDIDGIRIKYDGRGDDEFANQDVWVARRPAQIKSAIGNSGAFDPANPDITKSADREDRATSAWQTPSASKFDDWVYKLQDKQVDTKRVVDEIKDVAGALADDLDVYLQEELFHGRAAKRTEDFVNKELRPLVDAMAKDGLKIEDLDTFLHARHAREANAVIAQRNPEIQDGGSGMTNQDAADYFANLDEAQRRKLEAAAAKVDSILAETRKMMVDYQLESPDVVRGWGQMFQHYVPLMREDEGAGAGAGIGQGFSIKGREVKSRTGSTRKVVDIFANIAMQRERTIVRGEKNRVSQALHGLAAASPNKEFWTVDKVPTTPTFNPATGLVEDRPDTLFKMRDNVIVSKVLEQDDEGRTVAREKAVIFNEKNERAVRMATALKNLDAAQLEGLMGASAAVTRYFASINTQYNPVFGIINLMRDVQGAIVNLNTTELKDDKLKVARGTMSALMGIMADARKARRGEAGTSEWSALWEDFQSVGGQTGYRQLFQTSADRAKDIQRALNPDAWMDSRWGRIFTAGGTLKVPLSVAMKGARWLFDLLSDYNLAMENGIRLSAYKVALDKGMSRERAASLAKNLTVNFNRKGQVGQQAGALYAFFNAAMQGTARLGQVLFEMEPGKAKTIRLSALGKKVVYGGMLLGTTQALALAAAGFSDDDPPDFVRERSLIIPTGGKTYISIPMPLGLHVIPNIGRVTTEWALGGFKNTPQRVASLLGTFADSFNPIGNAGWSMQTVAPTALDPLVALTENKDWQGRPIAKESMNRDMPGPQLYRDTATSWGKLISESINYLSGGDKYSRGVLSPTPDQIDYLIGQLTGGVGREISKVEQTAVGLVRGEDVPTYKVPLVGRLIGDSGSQASEGTAFYANAQKLNKLETEIKLLREDGKTAEAQALRAGRPEAYLMTQANYAERAIQRLRKEKSELIKDGAPREKIREIEERITARMAGLNRAMEALEAAR